MITNTCFRYKSASYNCIHVYVVCLFELLLSHNLFKIFFTNCNKGPRNYRFLMRARYHRNDNMISCTMCSKVKVIDSRTGVTSIYVSLFGKDLHKNYCKRRQTTKLQRKSQRQISIKHWRW